MSIEVPAPAADVWTAMTTSEGWRAWAATMAHVDFRLGGVNHFAWGNAWTLQQLWTRFEHGPIDWKRKAEPAAATT